jgi:hypothetical protein
VYGGDSNFIGATSTAFTQTVNKATSTTTLTLSPNPAISGETATLTAQVTPGATGNVQFRDGSTVLGTQTLVSGSASFSSSTFIAAFHSFTAIYAGDSNFTGSTSSVLNTTVEPEVSLSVSDPNPTFGEAETITATLPAGATGTVTFSDEVGGLGTAAVAPRRVTTSTLSVGLHSIMATYSGDTNNPAATSRTLFLTVSKATASVNVASTLNPSVYGHLVTLTATLTPGATGTVSFADGANSLGTATINSGSASVSVNNLSVGPHNIVATYSGDANFQ